MIASIGLLLAPTLALASPAAFNVANYPAKESMPPTNTPWIRSFLANRSKLPQGENWRNDRTRCMERNAWAFTFNQGPSAVTPLVLEALARHGVKGTFFVTGAQALAYPEILLQTYKAGHQLGISSFSETDFSTLTDEQIVAEIGWTAKIIKDITGVTPTALRPPLNDLSPSDNIRHIVKDLGLDLVLYSKDSEDSKLNNWNEDQGPISTSVIDSFKKWTDPSAQRTGSISLQHVGMPGPASQVEPVLAIIKNGSNGLRAQKIDECIGKNAYDEALWTKLKMNGTGNPANVNGTNVNGALSGTGESSAMATISALAVTGLYVFGLL
jgi:peptidoglycan/xylan/chitin deacetylase (PgdA/CDA1 family)